MGLPQGSEWIILLVIALLIFGGTRLAGIGKGTGRAIREFKEEVKGDPKPVEPPTVTPTETPVVHPEGDKKEA